MKPKIAMFLALAAPTLSACGGLGFGSDGAPGKTAAATAPGAATTSPHPLAPVTSVQMQPLPPASGTPAPAAQAASVGGGSVTQAAAQPVPSGAALGGVLGGPIGASLAEADREAAWNAQLAALNSGQSRSWRGVRGVFGFVAPGAETGGGCRAYSQTIYVAGRPNRGQGVACRQPDGTWKMTSQCLWKADGGAARSSRDRFERFSITPWSSPFPALRLTQLLFSLSPGNSTGLEAPASPRRGLLLYPKPAEPEPTGWSRLRSVE